MNWNNNQYNDEANKKKKQALDGSNSESSFISSLDDSDMN
jgi:hypothetical protein